MFYLLMCTRPYGQIFDTYKPCETLGQKYQRLKKIALARIDTYRKNNRNNYHLPENCF